MLRTVMSFCIQDYILYIYFLFNWEIMLRFRPHLQVELDEKKKKTE